MGFPIEPRPWPKALPPPPPSTVGPTYRWYCTFVIPGGTDVQAAVVDGVSRKDILQFIHMSIQSRAANFHSVNSIGFSGWEKSEPPPIDMEEIARRFSADRARDRRIGNICALIIVPAFVFAFIKLVEWALRR